MTCPDCETYKGIKQKMIYRGSHYYCPRCGLIIEKFVGSKV